MSGADLNDALSDMWRSVLLFVPTALAFLAILLIGYVLARLVRTVLVKTLRRIGFDRAVERGAIGRSLGGRVEPSDLCAKIAFYAVLLFALQLAFGIWGPNAVSDLLTALIGWLPRAFVAIVIIVVAAAIGGAVRDLIGSALGGLAYGRVLARAAYWLIVALGVIAALDQVQIATAVTQPVLIAVLATVAGVLIVGVGGGLIRPMQQRWETWLERASTESAAIREHARSYADERARVAAEKKAAEAARVAAERAAEEALLAEEARVAEEARQAEEARVVEEARQAERARAAEQARVAEEARLAEQARIAEEARASAVTEAARIEAERVAGEAERERALEAAAEEKTQVIPLQRPWPGSDDRPHIVPGFDDPEPAGAEPDATAAIPTRSGEGAGATGEPAEGDEAGRPGHEAGRPGHAASAPTRGASAADEPGGGAARPADDDADTTAEVTSQGDGPERAGRESGSAVTISQGERPVLPQQGGAAEEEKTQVIRARPDDETRP